MLTRFPKQKVGRYYEPSVPHIYPEVRFTGFTECSYFSARAAGPAAKVV
jgi:hypothetical protein